jgi:flavin reductase ActVB
VLTCLANDAECASAFAAAERWNIHVLPHRHTDLAVRFSTLGADMFAGTGFEGDADGLPILRDVSTSLRCSAYSKVAGGDHSVLIGRVVEVETCNDAPFLYFRRKFHSLEASVA